MLLLKKQMVIQAWLQFIDTRKIRSNHCTSVLISTVCHTKRSSFVADDRAVMENFRSVNPSCVHACGHDGHIAIGLELARRIRSHISNYRGMIKLLFQPAEETILGAQSMVDKGLLSDVDYFLAVHLALSAERVPLPSHAIACGVCDFMSNHRLDVTFHPNIVSYDAAQGTHSTLLAACSAALNLHCIASHEKGLCRINVGQLKATSCPNRQ